MEIGGEIVEDLEAEAVQRRRCTPLDSGTDRPGDRANVTNGQPRLASESTASNAKTAETGTFNSRSRRISAMTCSWPPTDVFQTPNSHGGGSGGRPVTSALRCTRSFSVGP